MSIKFSILPPAIIYLRRVGSVDRWGRSRGPVVVMPADFPDHMREHELTHVKQWWVLTLASASVLAVLAYFVPQVPFGVIGLSVSISY